MHHCIKCGKFAEYYDITYRDFKFCHEHSNDNMNKIIYQRCSYIDCKFTAHCGYYNNKPKYCDDHKLKNMVSIINNYCNNDKCENIANYSSGNGTTYCKMHKRKNMTKIIRIIKCKYCEFSNKYDYVCPDCIDISNRKQNAILKYLTHKLNNNILSLMIVTTTGIHFEFITHSIVILFEVYDTYIRRLYLNNHPLHIIIIEYKYVKKKLLSLVNLIKIISEQTFHEPYFRIQCL